MALKDTIVVLSVDTTEAEAKIDALLAKVNGLRQQIRPWWCPRWLFRLINGI